MARREHCVKVPLRQAEQALRLLRARNLVAKGLRVRRVEGYLLIPLTRSSDDAVSLLRKHLVSAEVCEELFEETVLGKTFKDYLKGKIPENLLKSIPSSYDIIGDIAIIQLPEESLRYGDVIAEAIMRVAKNVKSVYAAGPVEGEYRVRKLTHLGGERRTETIHKEYGVLIRVDVGKTYYNPSLSEEHHRVASLVSEGEDVADLFCGVGPFTLHIITMQKARVFAVDINPYAIKCLIESLELNSRKIKGRAVPVMGDVRDFLAVVAPASFDRVIMNLPHAAVSFIGEVLDKVKPAGYLHVYTVARSADEAREAVMNAVPEGFKAVILNATRVLDYAPRKLIYRVDVRVGSSGVLQGDSHSSR